MKFNTPKYLMKLCEEIAKGYEMHKTVYEQKRMDIIYSTYSGEAVISRSPNRNTSSAIESKAERLEKLEGSVNARLVRAVEQALTAVGADVADESRRKLRKAILLNIESGREFPYEELNIDEFSRRDFYRRRGRFIEGIAAGLGLWEG